MKEGGYSEFDKFKNKLARSNDPFEMVYDAISGNHGEEIRNAFQEMYDDIVKDSGYRLHPDDDCEIIIDTIVDQLVDESGGQVDDELDEIKRLAHGDNKIGEGWSYSDHQDSKYDDQGDASDREKARAQARRRAENDGWGTEDERENDAELDESVKTWALGGAALIAALVGINKYEAAQMMKNDPQLARLAQFRERAASAGDEAKVQELDDRIKTTMDHLTVTGDEVRDQSGKPVDPVYEAEYQGHKVSLNKPMQGDVKKSKVYVKKPNGKVVKVNFGDKNMRIHKSNPERRKSFRARHRCENPGPKWKARYWSCKALTIKAVSSSEKSSMTMISKKSVG